MCREGRPRAAPPEGPSGERVERTVPPRPLPGPFTAPDVASTAPVICVSASPSIPSPAGLLRPPGAAAPGGDGPRRRTPVMRPVMRRTLAPRESRPFPTIPCRDHDDQRPTHPPTPSNRR
jgi:hypothetical protein